VATLFLATDVLAKDAGLSPLNFNPQVSIPGTAFEGKVVNEKTGEIVVNISKTGDAIALYVTSLYKYGAGIAGLVALFMVVLAGWKWLMAGGNSEKISSAKDTIQGAVIGLFLLFGGYLLLSQISENLVNFDTLVLPLIEELPLDKSICESYDSQIKCEANSMCRWEELANSANGLDGICVLKKALICEADSQVVNISVSGKLTTTASEPRLMPIANAALQKAADSLQEGESLTVTSAYRSWSLQQTLYDCYINKVGNKCPDGCKTCNLAAPPSCTAPHQTGLAVDICYTGWGVNTCSDTIMNSNYNCIGSSNLPCTEALSQAQTRLRNIMTGAGFTALASEWWHFKL